MIQNPNVRKALYVLSGLVLALLAAHGLITSDDVGRLEHIVEAVVTLITAMAAAHTPKAPDDRTAP